MKYQTYFFPLEKFNELENARISDGKLQSINPAADFNAHFVVRGLISFEWSATNPGVQPIMEFHDSKTPVTKGFQARKWKHNLREPYSGPIRLKLPAQKNGGTVAFHNFECLEVKMIPAASFKLHESEAGDWGIGPSVILGHEEIIGSMSGEVVGLFSISCYNMEGGGIAVATDRGEQTFTTEGVNCITPFYTGPVTITKTAAPDGTLAGMLQIVNIFCAVPKT